MRLRAKGVKLLLDTQAFLWWMADSSRLSARARSAISNPENEIFFSIASAWEISIKRSLGKLKASDDLAAVIEAETFELLDITVAHIETLGQLEHRHHDPFDRLLIAQASTEHAKLVSGDAVFRHDTATSYGEAASLVPDPRQARQHEFLERHALG
jgi:PIN domain nuclease of toxin-antitoxin system